MRSEWTARGRLFSAATAMVLLSASFACAATIEPASTASAGGFGNGASSAPAISADGRYVAFASDADNLVAGDYVPRWGTDPDIFVRDLETGATELASDGIGETGMFWRTVCRAPAISGDGRFVSFECFSGTYFAHRMNFDVYVRDRLSGATELASAAADGTPGNGGSSAPSMSADGRYVAFASAASNLAPGDGNGVQDIFVRDRQSGAVERIGGNGPSSSPSISADGRYVAFASAASNLAAGDGNGAQDIFVFDRRAGAVQRIGGNAPSSAPSMSADGRYVAFVSAASDLAAGDGNGLQDIFVLDRPEGKIERIGGNGGSSAPSMSADGRYVSFASTASDLVEGDANALEDVFVRDLRSGKTLRISLTEDGAEGNGGSAAPVLSADGRRAAFQSLASNLVPGDANGVGDVFVRTSSLDTTPPEVSLDVTPGLLWPPNKKYVPVRIDGAAADDSGEVTVEITLDDEYGEMVGMIVPGFGETVELEAWREGDDPDGRLYTVTVVATDAAGNTTTTTAEAIVPHDMRGKKGE